MSRDLTISHVISIASVSLAELNMCMWLKLTCPCTLSLYSVDSRDTQTTWHTNHVTRKSRDTQITCALWRASRVTRDIHITWLVGRHDNPSTMWCLNLVQTWNPTSGNKGLCYVILYKNMDQLTGFSWDATNSEAHCLNLALKILKYCIFR